MEKEVMEKIKQYALVECQRAFGFAGLAETDDMFIINSGKNQDLRIEVTIREK